MTKISMIKKSLIVFIFILLMNPVGVHAWGWWEHLLALDESIDRARDTKLAQACSEHLDYCRAGAVLPDSIGIFDYVKCWFGIESEERCSYKISHNWGYSDRMFEECIDVNDKRGRAIGTGAAIGHLIPDSTSHNDAVVDIIKNLKCSNVVCHLLLEAKRENQIKNDPKRNYIVPITQNVLNVLLEPMDNDEEFKQMYPEYDDYLDVVMCAMGADPPVTKEEMRENIEKLSVIFGRDEFYTKALAPQADSSSWFERGLSKVYPFLMKFSRFLPTKDLEEYHKMTVNWMTDTFENWELRKRADKLPHGFESLRQAERDAIPGPLSVGHIWGIIGLLLLFLIAMGIRWTILKIPKINSLYRSFEDIVVKLFNSIFHRIKRKVR